jgi:predicted Fe-S protein YdhL (DUF1289 family)
MQVDTLNDVDRQVPHCALPSPCIRICHMSTQTGLCVGCLRTMDEITCWANATDDVKRKVWAAIEQRKAR